MSILSVDFNTKKCYNSKKGGDTMKISFSKDTVLFCTPFSEEFELIQKFSGVAPIKAYYNTPVNFTEAGLKYKNKGDIWHIDVPFAYSNDETPPITINGKWLGANHIFPFAVAVYNPDHGKDYCDIGSLWQDAESTKWTLTNVTEDVVTFVSENIGESYTKYAFKTEIASKLTHISDAVNKDDIICDGEMWKAALSPSIRITKCKVIAYADGKVKTINRSTECDYAEIHEYYDIVNPVSMVEEIRKNRPEGGYTSPFYGAMGETMVTVSRIYRIENDGTITCDFKIKKHMDVHILRCLGVMHQEKLNTYGGGIFRYIPKSLPYICEDGTFDFSKPYPLAPGPFPQNEYLTPEFWEDEKNPPDRIVDYFRNTDGKDVIGFSAGYLPVYDGVPEIRTKQLISTVNLVRTRKAYPYFMHGDITECHGVAYRKYFEISKDKTSVYTIPYMDKTYIYVDLFNDEEVTVPANSDITLYEKSDSISYKFENGKLSVKGKGYAMFIN